MSRSIVEGWEEAYASFWSNFAPCFTRKPSFKRAQSYVRGLMGKVERKNGWQLAEYLGYADPYGVQNLLSRATWDVDLMQKKLAVAAREALLLPGEKGILIVDETGFLKKGDKSVGVKRQYSGTAGRTENCQVGVFLALAGSKGSSLIDRELYLPDVEWCQDAERRKAAGVPEEIEFSTKPRLALDMLERAFQQGFEPEWVLADAAYGNDSKFRIFLQERKQSYVVAVSKNHCVWENGKQIRADEVMGKLADKEWKRISAGHGAKGERFYDWAAIRLGYHAETDMFHCLLARRSIGEKPDLAFYLCYAPEGVGVKSLAVAAGKRWNIECCFERAKQDVGLDEYEVRSWQGWQRHTILLMVKIFTKHYLKTMLRCTAWKHQVAKQKTSGNTGVCGQWNFSKAV